MIRHQAIIFYGSSPGTGKSTLSSFLYEQLSLHNIPVLWIYEDDVLRIPYFVDFVADILSGNPRMMETLRQATRDYVQACQSTHAVGTTDSIYPCVNWLIATALYSNQEIADFGAELEQLLAPLHPLVIYLDADPKVALQRAIDQRGEAWFTGLVEALNSYAVNRQHPLRTIEEVADYFRTQAMLSLDVLQQWAFPLLIMDAMQTPLPEAKAILLSYLGIAELHSQPSLSIAEVEKYVGLYQSTGDPPITNPLHISLKEGKLWVNTYWPNGCPLHAEGDSHLRLENTSHRIHFQRAPDRAVTSLVYSMGETDYLFTKIE